MEYNFMQNKNLSGKVQAIKQNQARNEERQDEAYRREMISTDKENCEKVKALLLEGYVVKNQIAEGSTCTFELEKNSNTETIKISYSDNINEIKKLLSVSE